MCNFAAESSSLKGPNVVMPFFLKSSLEFLQNSTTSSRNSIFVHSNIAVLLITHFPLSFFLMSCPLECEKEKKLSTLPCHHFLDLLTPVLPLWRRPLNCCNPWNSLRCPGWGSPEVSSGRLSIRLQGGFPS